MGLVPSQFIAQFPICANFTSPVQRLQYKKSRKMDSPSRLFATIKPVLRSAAEYVEA
jgi:hypothetical protein